MATPQKPRAYTVRLLPWQHEWLQEQARARGASVSQQLRDMIAAAKGDQARALERRS